MTMPRNHRKYPTTGVQSTDRAGAGNPASVCGMESPAPIIENARIEALAYELWQARGCPQGSPEVDWHRAEELLSNDDGIDAGRTGLEPVPRVFLAE